MGELLSGNSDESNQTELNLVRTAVAMTAFQRIVLAMQMAGEGYASILEVEPPSSNVHKQAVEMVKLFRQHEQTAASTLGVLRKSLESSEATIQAYLKNRWA